MGVNRLRELFDWCREEEHSRIHLTPAPSHPVSCRRACRLIYSARRLVPEYLVPQCHLRNLTYCVTFDNFLGKGDLKGVGAALASLKKKISADLWQNGDMEIYDH